MSKNKEKIFTIEDIQDAYRKLKTHFYYDNTNHFMRRQIIILRQLLSTCETMRMS